MIAKSLYAVAALAASLVLPAAASAQAHATHQASKDIVQTAIAAGTFNTLVAAVKAAGLVETLQGKGPFTVFAPTDAAFAKLPAGTVESLLANPQKLASILTFHVVPGTVMAADIVKARAKPATVNGQSLDVVVRDGDGVGQRRQRRHGRRRGVEWCHPRDRHGAHSGPPAQVGQ